MRIARLLVAALSLTLALAAPAAGQRRAQPTQEEETARLRPAVEASAARMSAAFNRGDIAMFIQSLASDVWVFPPNAEPFQGPAAADNFFARSYTQGTRNLQLTTTGLERSGGLAYETGTYNAEYPTPGQSGAMTRDYGKYVHIWKRGADGAWRIHLVTWSSNLPPPQMPRYSQRPHLPPSRPSRSRRKTGERRQIVPKSVVLRSPATTGM
jgi:ketosteroid isomerase-like protein